MTREFGCRENAGSMLKTVSYSFIRLLMAPPVGHFNSGALSCTISWCKGQNLKSWSEVITVVKSVASKWGGGGGVITQPTGREGCPIFFLFITVDRLVEVHA